MEANFSVKILYNNFSQSISYLKKIIELCPDDLWNTHNRFYYLAYHTAIFLDYYLSDPVKDFRPVLPYRLIDPKDIPADGIDDVLPEKNYSWEDIIRSLDM